MKRLILVGSPRTNGRSAHLGEELFESLIEDCPEDELFLVPISEIDITPCIYCNACEKTSEVITKDDDGNEVSCQKHRCIFDDDMQNVYDLVDEVDEIIVVCPVFFSGAPAPFKSLLDRLQPYYWSKARLGEKRPATLHVIGEGGDPHGYGALVSEVRSALAVAGFKLERVLDWVGKIDVNGEIMAEAEEHLLDGSSVLGDAAAHSLPSFGSKMDSSWAISEGARGEEEGTQRPKLNLRQGRSAGRGVKGGDAAKGSRNAKGAGGSDARGARGGSVRGVKGGDAAKGSRNAKGAGSARGARGSRGTKGAGGSGAKASKATTSSGDKHGSRKGSTRG